LEEVALVLLRKVPQVLPVQFQVLDVLHPLEEEADLLIVVPLVRVETVAQVVVEIQTEVNQVELEILQRLPHL
jgi:hypothetical protein